MAEQEFLCARCAKHTSTCCQGTEIYVTPADVKRIAAHSGRDDFAEFRVAENQNYQDQDDDPIWRDHVFREDGSRRTLKHQPNGDCTFLGQAGCTLPLQVRPLVCRLYPFDYTADGILDKLSPGCPLELLLPGQGLIEVLQMNLDDARKWHRMLYEEILQEPRRLTCESV